jgi:hypothetical protein
MQKIFNKLAKTNKPSTSVKHKVDLSNITELEDHVEFVLDIVESESSRSIDLLNELGESMGALDGAMSLVKEDYEHALELMNAIEDLGIDTPDSLIRVLDQLMNLVDMRKEVQPSYEKTQLAFGVVTSINELSDYAKNL